MTTDTYWIWFRTDNYPDKPVKTFIETSLACGLQTAQSGDESFFDRYQTNQHDIVRDTDKYDIETVMDEITAADGGKLYFTHNESAFIINIRTLDSDADRPTPNVNLRLGKYDIKSTDIDLILDWIESQSITSG